MCALSLFCFLFLSCEHAQYFLLRLCYSRFPSLVSFVVFLVISSSRFLFLLCLAYFLLFCLFMYVMLPIFVPLFVSDLYRFFLLPNPGGSWESSSRVLAHTKYNKNLGSCRCMRASNRKMNFDYIVLDNYNKI